jgi:uncharacterized protein (TIGR00730 family)
MTNSEKVIPRAARTISLDDEESVKRLLRKTVFGLWDIVGDLTRLRPSRPERYRVTIFGSARTRPGHFVYAEVKRFGRALAEMGCDVVTGGGPGLMQAANEGAKEAVARVGQQSLGIRVELPFEQTANPFIDEQFEHQTFFTRLHHFVLASDAFVVVPGGIGTALELFMVWQLIQVGHLREVPLIVAGPGYADLVRWCRQWMLSEDLELTSEKDLAIPQCVEGADQAIALLREHHARWLQCQPRIARAVEIW